ncbi:hypothetical protein [Maribacter sp. IgM3_T14_3]|uniref:hypothetical protein n=1 Tax=Maribacter sp. IgM3_T14_3 TaxID=3415140 RepID=UPI003C6EDFBD
MKYIILFSLLITFGCKNQTEKNTGINNEDYIEFGIDFLNATVLLPKTYEKLTADELKTKLLKHVENSKQAEFITQSFETLKQSPFGFAVFADKNNYTDYIWVRQGEFVPLDKALANQYLGMVSARVEQDWGGIGMDYERLENRFLQTDKSQIIKIKYKTELDNRISYHTQYVITSKIKTFDFLVVSNQNMDLENLIKRINVR